MKAKAALILLILLLTSTHIMAKNTVSKNNWSVKTAYSRSCWFEFNTSENGISHIENVKYRNYRPMIGIDINRYINPFFELGVNLGYSPAKVYLSPGPKHTSKTNLLAYGLNVNYHILPHFTGTKRIRLDLYLSGKIGSNTDKQFQFDIDNYIDYGLYIGAAFYISKQFGLFAEYGISNSTYFRTGLTYRF